ncbi:FHA domain-containing protein [Peterkaempfera sp. SMS 1(5)a]|uniref:FHA domain-containing protein n=1 Tax=Peterkaempfera podocarpi TaxID=3232308 RepID=UPI00366CAE0F
MPICPRGHDSQAEDWCDVCGFPMSGHNPAPSYGAPPGLAPQGVAPQGIQSPGMARPGMAPAGMAPPPFSEPETTDALATCPICRTPQTGRYCEECGYDYDLSAPSRGIGHQPPQQQSYGYPQPSAPAPAPSAPAADLFGTYAPAPQQSAPPMSAPPMSAPPMSGPPMSGPPMSGPPMSGPPMSAPQPSYGGFDTDFRLTPPSQSATPPAPEPPPVRATWVAVVSADREYFTQMMARSGPEAQGLYFPPYCPERRIPMTGRGQLRIGRRSQQRGTVPEIDLSVPPEDPGASHQHALLQEQPDGNWIVVDQDSTNGTTVNGSPDPIAPHTGVPLNDGDRVHVGAWTTITVHRA